MPSKKTPSSKKKVKFPKAYQVFTKRGGGSKQTQLRTKTK